MKGISYDEINNAEITTFLSVAKTLNMSVSASELSITQSAVSQRISRLEKTNGLILFVRTNRGLQLTPAGKVFYEEMQQSRKYMEKAFDRAYMVQAGTVQSFTICHDNFFDIPLLFEIIDRFQKKYPGINTKVTINTKEGVDDLFLGNADIMIRPDSNFASKKEAL